MNETKNIFEFKQCVSILKSTGKKAKNINEFRDCMLDVPDSSIAHHTFEYFLKGHVLEYTNDFAQWVGESLEERELAERLSNIDPYEFNNVSSLRKVLVHVIDDHLSPFTASKEVQPVSEFFFNQTMTLVFSTGITVTTMPEFLSTIKYIDDVSIYYHFYDARVRASDRIDDFSRWFEDILDKPEIARQIRAIDPFMHQIEGIRKHIIDIVEVVQKQEMEKI